MNALFLLVLIVTCAAAAYLEVKCLREPCIPDNQSSLAGRRIKIVGYCIIAMRCASILIDGTEINWLGGFAFLLVAFSDVIRCANRLHLPSSKMVGAER